MIRHKTISYGMFEAFVERCHSKTSSFHISIGEMYITLDDVLFLLHLSIRGKLLDHFRISRLDALDMMGTYLEAAQVKPK